LKASLGHGGAVGPDCNSFRDSGFELILSPLYCRRSARFALRHFLLQPRDLPMDQFQKRPFVVPIELVIVIAINLVVVVAGYYAIMMWGLFRS
jgi:hypothetical protein